MWFSEILISRWQHVNTHVCQSKFHSILMTNGQENDFGSMSCIMYGKFYNFRTRKCQQLKTHSKKIPPEICVILCIFAANFSGVSPGWMVVIVTNDLARNGCHSDGAAHVLYVSVKRVEQTGRHCCDFTQMYQCSVYRNTKSCHYI